MFLVLLESNGNQGFIFDSNRQREHVGASFLLTRLPAWTREAAAGVAGSAVVMSTSGKVLVTVPVEEQARALVTAVTARAMSEAPGIDVTGGWIRVEGGRLDQRALDEVHAVVAAYNAARIPPVGRFPQRPFVDLCTESGLPASTPLAGDRRHDAEQRLSEPARAKRRHAARGRAALLDTLRRHGVGNPEVLVPDLDKLEQALGRGADGDPDVSDRSEGTQPPLAWVGVVHVDGNGVGAAFARLDDLRPPHLDLPGYLRGLSEALDAATEAAYARAAQEVLAAAAEEAHANGAPAPSTLPVVPVLLGADDVTVITDGRFALVFAESFLRAFGDLTAENPLLADLGGRPGAGLTAAAGVAVVKPKFPFFQAYRLAEQLCASAKRRSRRESVLDFHVLYDTAGVDLDRLRPQYEQVTLRPLPLGTPPADPASSAPGQTGQAAHTGETWETLLSRAARLSGAGDGGGVPRHQSVRVRLELREEPAAAEASWAKALAHPEYADAARAVTAEGLLRWLGPDGRPVAALLDCLEIAELVPRSYLARYRHVLLPRLNEARAVLDQVPPPGPPWTARPQAEAMDTGPLQPGRGRALRVEVGSDWSVGSGAGVPGGVDAVVRRDAHGLPYLTGTGLTGVLAHAARQAGRALDEAGAGGEGAGEGWAGWVGALFGAEGRPALVAVAPAHATAHVRAVNQPGVALDETGTAAPDQLRLVERAAPTVLTSQLRLLDRLGDGRRVVWTADQARAATDVLAAAARLVEGVGADRRRGSGQARCELLGAPITVERLRALHRAGPPGLPAVAPLPVAVVSASATPGVPAELHRLRITFDLTQPLHASAGRRSNVLRSHAYLPGTTVLAWLHRRMLHLFPGVPGLSSAVTTGGLLAGDATVAAEDGSPGLPVPLAFLRRKLRGLQVPVLNRLVTTPAAEEDLEPWVPMREGWVLPVGGGWAWDLPTRVVAMHTSLDAATGTSTIGGLYAMEAIATGTTLVADVHIRAGLLEQLPDDWTAQLAGPSRLGGKARTEYGGVDVRVDEPQLPPREPPTPGPGGELTVWLLSHYLPAGTGHRLGGIADLVAELVARGVGVADAEPPAPGRPVATATRTRRIDGWHAASRIPRNTLVTLQAGSCLRLPWDDSGAGALTEAAVTGLGARRAEGFGRVAFQHPLLQHPQPFLGGAAR